MVAVRASPCGGFLAVASADSTASLWRLTDPSGSAHFLPLAAATAAVSLVALSSQHRHRR